MRQQRDQHDREYRDHTERVNEPGLVVLLQYFEKMVHSSLWKGR
jgi:hypothetical protein